ncbi:MAG: hypothetical protein WCK33_12070 [Phycisphaerae bacterium]
MEDIDQWLRAREAIFFTRMGLEFLLEFDEAGLDPDDWDHWYQCTGPNEATTDMHQRRFLDSINELAGDLHERVQVISGERAEAEQVISRRELGACMQTLERFVPRLQEAGLLLPPKVVRVSANMIVLARLEERVGIPDAERLFRWAAWTIERGHIVCAVDITEGRPLCWSVW